MGHVSIGRSVSGLQGTYSVERALSERSGRFMVSCAIGEHEAMPPERPRQHALLEEVRIGEADAWERIDALFRQARELRHLRDPGIPALVDLFVTDGERARVAEAGSLSNSPDGAGKEAGLPSVVLVRGWVEGVSVAEAIRSGRRFTVPELHAMLLGLLRIRHYLDQLRPVLVHGDIRPSNVILGPQGPSLVGFGASIGAGTSVTGDLEGIALTVLSAASHVPPTEMNPSRTGSVDIRRVAPGLSPELRRALSLCLEGPSGKRAESAAAVSRVLLQSGAGARETLAKAYRSRATRAGIVTTLLAGTASIVLPLLDERKVPGEFATIEASPVSDTPPEPTPGDEAPPPPESKMPQANGHSRVSEAPQSSEPSPTDDADHRPTSLFWTGVVEAGPGLRAKDQCLLQLEVAEVMDGCADSQASWARCNVSVSCGERALLRDAPAEYCLLAETEAHETLSYRASFSLREALSRDAAFDGRSGLLILDEKSDGEATHYRLSFDPESMRRPVHQGRLSASARSTTKDIRRGRVALSSRSDVRAHESCTLTIVPIERNGGIMFDECHALVRCHDTVVYEGSQPICPSSGDGDGLQFLDDLPSALDDDPRLEWLTDELIISDFDDKKLWEVAIQWFDHDHD
jgi:hypothetical protein